MTDRISKTAQTLLLSGLLAAATLAAFWPVLGNDFIRYDDPDYVSQNLRVTGGLAPENVLWAFETGHTGNWHPVTWLSHLLDVQLFGLRPAGHHLTSLFLHVLNSVLLFLLFNHLTASVWRSFFAAGLFALHPLHVESVAWVAERKDVLSTLFFLLTLWAYAQYAREKRGSPGGVQAAGPASTSPAGPVSRVPAAWYVSALAFFSLGLMSKPMLVTVPFVLLLLDFWPLGRSRLTGSPTATRSLPQLVVEKIPFFALSAISSVVTIVVQRRSHALTAEAPFSVNLANAIVSCAKYLARTFWPADLAILYPHPVLCYGVSRQWSGAHIALTAALLLALSLATLLSFRNRPWLAVGWFWFLGTLVPVLGLLQVGSQALADRYTYIPLIGIFVLLAWNAAEWTTRGGFGLRPAIVAGSLVLMACAFATHRQAGYWRDTATVFEHALAVTPDNAPAHSVLAYEALRDRDYQAALVHCQQALAADPDWAEARALMGTALLGLGKPGKAEEAYLPTLRLQPWNVSARSGLAAVYWQTGRKDDVVKLVTETLKARPEDPDANYYAGLVLIDRGQLKEAAAHFAAALNARPGFEDALARLAAALFRSGDFAGAEPRFRELTRLRPSNPEDRINLGGVLWQLGRLAESLEQYQESIRLAPENPVAHCNLGLLLAKLGKVPEAEAALEQAIRLRQDYPEARAALERLRKQKGQGVEPGQTVP